MAMRWECAGHAAACIQRAIIARLVVPYAIDLDQWKGTRKVDDVLLYKDKTAIVPRSFLPMQSSK